MTNTLPEIDAEQLRSIVAKDPDKFRALLDEVDQPLEDRFGRAIHKTDRVITPAGEAGMVVRVDKKTKRVLVETADHRTRLLMAHRVEALRGRPRKDSLRPAV